MFGRPFPFREGAGGVGSLHFPKGAETGGFEAGSSLFLGDQQFADGNDLYSHLVEMVEDAGQRLR